MRIHFLGFCGTAQIPRFLAVFVVQHRNEFGMLDVKPEIEVDELAHPFVGREIFQIQLPLARPHGAVNALEGRQPYRFFVADIDIQKALVGLGSPRNGVHPRPAKPVLEKFAHGRAQYSLARLFFVGLAPWAGCCGRPFGAYFLCHVPCLSRESSQFNRQKLRPIDSKIGRE